jgi:hypothetical protein
MPAVLASDTNWLDGLTAAILALLCNLFQCMKALNENEGNNRFSLTGFPCLITAGQRAGLHGSFASRLL